MNDRQALSLEMSLAWRYLEMIDERSSGSILVFPRIKLDDRSSIISRYLQALTILQYKFQRTVCFSINILLTKVPFEQYGRFIRPNGELHG